MAGLALGGLLCQLLCCSPAAPKTFQQDPETSIHLLQTYVLPVLVYGMEVVTHKAALMERLERTYTNFIKQILSLPVTVADPAVYVLSGAVPVEAVIHKKALMLFGSVCRLDEDSVEKRIARRQLCVKSFNSNSWFTTVRKLFFKYDIPDCCRVHPRMGPIHFVRKLLMFC